MNGGRINAPDLMRLRTEPNYCHPGCQNHKPVRYVDAATQPSCPRGNLLRRMQLYTGYLNDGIQDFRTPQTLLLPYGAPEWNDSRTSIRLPPVLRWSGCDAVEAGWLSRWTTSDCDWIGTRAFRPVRWKSDTRFCTGRGSDGVADRHGSHYAAAPFDSHRFHLFHPRLHRQRGERV